MNPRTTLAIALSTVGRARAEPGTCAAAAAAEGHARPPWPDSSLLQLAAVAQPRSEPLGLANASAAGPCPSHCRSSLLPATGWPNRCAFSDCSGCEECRAPEEAPLPEVDSSAAPDVKAKASAPLPEKKKGADAKPQASSFLLPGAHAAGPERGHRHRRPHHRPAPASPASAGAPRVGVTMGAVKATGDPHLVNMYGQKFDILHSGVHTLIEVPKKEAAGRMLLRVSADVQQFGGACADLYFRTMNITGRWVPRKRGLFFDAQRKSRQHAAKWMDLGKMKLKVVWGHTNRGVKYLNFFVKHLTDISSKFAVGGLLGEDDHTAASTPHRACKRMVAL